MDGEGEWISNSGLVGISGLSSYTTEYTTIS